jgi:multidrug resistance efflux pump
VLSSALGIIAIVIMIIAGRVASRNQSVTPNTSNIKKVSLVDVASFRDNKSIVSADGIIESISQSELKSQISAPVSQVLVQVGDDVYTGKTLVTLQNADIRAQLDQARAGLKLAQGQFAGSGVSLDSAKTTAIETINSSYITADQIVNVDIEQFLFKSSGGNPKLTSFISDAKLNSSLEDFYLGFKNRQIDWKASIDALKANSKESDIISVVNKSQKNFQDISIFLDQISKAITEASAYTQNTNISTIFNIWQSTVNADRAIANNVSKSLIAAGSSLSNANIGYGSVANAQILSAEAIVKNLEVQLAKTVFISPINGKVASLPFRSGDLVQPGQVIATVVGGGGLQVKAFASGDDISRIKVGAKADIQGISGVVVNLAPSINQTNKKVEVKIKINDTENHSLVVGNNVTVTIEAGEQEVTSGIQNPNVYLLPIQNVKIVPGDAYVFTVDANSKLIKTSVMIGKISGGFIEIVSGLSDDMKIAAPVYELEVGEEVRVQ